MDRIATDPLFDVTIEAQIQSTRSINSHQTAGTASRGRIFSPHQVVGGFVSDKQVGAKSTFATAIPSSASR
jgi:hypothetical protein